VEGLKKFNSLAKSIMEISSLKIDRSDVVSLCSVESNKEISINESM
jgi:hypothetical protein